MLKIYNSLTRKKEEFKPLRRGRVGIYVCGPTVYDEPHIGHARSAYVFEVIRSYFEYRKYKVTFVRNVTDVDDKIINKALEEFKGENLEAAVSKVSQKYLTVYHKYMEALGIRPPDSEPKATKYIAKMQKFIKALIKKGAAYEAGGDVYFNVAKAKGYGGLSNQSLEMLESGARVKAGENKKDPLDFALWKKAKEAEPCWKSPWGRGRPGWHIECSVMSSDILGNEFDIHGGGVDLIFPHHENEKAQSEGLGKKFARYWIHNGLVTINKEKMAKSLGNFITVEELLKKYPADVLKILFLQTHYSQPVDFSWERMDEAKKAYERIVILMDKINKKVSSNSYHVTRKGNEKIGRIKNQFIEAMDDDFNTPKALGSVFELVSLANKNIDDRSFLLEAKTVVKKLLEVFGVSVKAAAAPQVLNESDISQEYVKDMINKRDKARRDKDFGLSDEIRKELEEKGIILEDTKEGTIWRKKL